MRITSTILAAAFLAIIFVNLPVSEAVACYDPNDQDCTDCSNTLNLSSPDCTTTAVYETATTTERTKYPGHRGKRGRRDSRFRKAIFNFYF